MCGLEFPDLETSLWLPYQDEGVMVIGLNVTGPWPANDSPEQIQSFIEQSGTTFPVVSDAGQSFFQWGAMPDTSPFPVDVVIDREGVIRYFAREYSADELRAAVEAWK